jgi:type II secretory pathway component PulM
MEMIVYVSRNRLPDGEARLAIRDIERAAQSRNVIDGITGVLLFSGCHFLQVIEGPREKLEHLMQRLTRDPRHSDIKIVLRDAIDQRRYAGWSMRCAEQITYALTFFSRLHYGFSTGTDMTIIEAMVDRELT